MLQHNIKRNYEKTFDTNLKERTYPNKSSKIQ